MTNITIPLSPATVEKATTVFGLNTTDVVAGQIAKLTTEMELANLIKYLASNAAEPSKELKLADAMLRTYILKDIEKKLNEQLSLNRQKEEIKEHHKNKVQFWLLAIAGTIFFACEGFDGITAVFGLASVPGIISLGVALIFSVFSVMVFLGFGLRQIAEHLGVRFKDAPDLVNEYVLQMDEIKKILNTTQELLNEDSPISNTQLDDYKSLLKMLNYRLTHIKQEKVKLDEARNQTSVKVLKTSLSVVTGIIFFSTGFFTGQAVALSIAGLFVAASATFPPILAAAVFLGVVAFLIYWYLERPGIENLIGRKLGLDDEKLEKLGTKKTDEMEQKIKSLQRRVEEKQKYQKSIEEIEGLEKTVRAKETVNDQIMQELDNVKSDLTKVKSELSESKVSRPASTLTTSSSQGLFSASSIPSNHGAQGEAFFKRSKCKMPSQLRQDPTTSTSLQMDV